METFRLIFWYERVRYTATVVKSRAGNTADYVVHPDSPEIIRKFGAGVTLFKENEAFAVNTSKDNTYMNYVNALTNAIREQEGLKD